MIDDSVLGRLMAYVHSTIDRYNKLPFEKQAAIAMLTFFVVVLMMNALVITNREDELIQSVNDTPTQIVEHENGTTDIIYKKELNGINQTITISGEGLSVVIGEEK